MRGHVDADRVGLRPWRVEDAAALAHLFDDPLVYRFTPIAEPFDVPSASRRIGVGTRGEATGRLRLRAIVVDDHPVGEVAAYRRDTSDEYSVSYVIGAAFRGSGLARQGLGLLIDELRDEWQATTVIAEISPDNPASQEVALSLGFTLDEDAIPTPRQGKDYSVLPWTLHF